MNLTGHATAECEPIIRSEMPELDSIRGVAILLVLFYHGYFWTYGVTGLRGFARVFVQMTRPGWLGVNLFFVLSGFLITGILLQSTARQDYYRRFYTRRALRILPAYYGVLLLLFVTGLRPRAYLILCFFYLANVTSLFGVPQVYGVLWSLAVEEHFYLLWPTAVRLLTVRALEKVAIGIVCVVPLLRALSFLVGWRENLSSYTWFVADGLAMGAWLAAYVRKPSFQRENLVRISVSAVGIAALATVAGARFGILTRERLLGATFQESCGDLAFLGLLGVVLLLGTSRRKSLVRWSLLKFYGDISYGLYLIHLLVLGQCYRLISKLWPQPPSAVGNFRIMTLYFAVFAACSTALAFLSRRYFEQPFLRMKDRGVPAPPRAAELLAR
jgi:peptidoglycan/LPS O-acetylase OafA/YrhL